MVYHKTYKFCFTKITQSSLWSNDDDLPFIGSETSVPNFTWNAIFVMKDSKCMNLASRLLGWVSVDLGVKPLLMAPFLLCSFS